MRLSATLRQEESFSRCGYLLAKAHMRGNFRARVLRLATAAALVIALSAVGVPAQSVTGDVSGKITDANGAVIPGAKVTVKNVGTGGV